MCKGTDKLKPNLPKFSGAPRARRNWEHGPARELESPERSANSQKASGQGQKRFQTRGMRKVWARLRPGLLGSQLRAARQLFRRPGHTGRKSYAWASRPQAASGISGTRHHSNAPQPPMQKFQPCSAGKCERPWITSRFEWATIIEIALKCQEKHRRAHKRPVEIRKSLISFINAPIECGWAPVDLAKN